MASKDKLFEKTTTCRNCGSENIENFCSNCGQKVYTKRFTLKAFFGVFLDAFDIEKGFIHTFLLLFTKPGVVINEYIKGKTKAYYNPLKYVLIIAGIYAFIILKTGILDKNMEVGQDIMTNNIEYMKQSQEKVNQNEYALEAQNKLLGKFKQYVNLIPLLMIPFTSLVTMWLYRSKKLVYGEFLIINSFVFAHSFVITTIILLLTALFFPELTKFLFAITGIATISYISYALFKIFKGSVFSAIVKTILIYILGTVFFFTFFMISFYLILIGFALMGVNIIELM